MALDTYDGLNTSLQDWLMRVGEAELVAKIPELIALAEEDFRDRVRVRELRTTKTGPHTSEFVTLPDDYLEMVDVKFIHDSGKEDPIFPMSELQMTDRSTVSNSFAYYYNIVGKQIQFRPAPGPDGTGQYKLTYYKKDTPLNGTNQVNEILINYPSLYLWGSLSIGGIYVRNQTWVSKWESNYERAILRANEAGRAGENTGPAQGNPPR